MKALYLMPDNIFQLVYGEKQRKELESILEFIGPQLNKDSLENFPKEKLAETEIIISSWGMPEMNDKILALFPNLKIIFYGAGSVKNFTTEAMWKKGIRIVSAWAANAVPVAEFAFAQIILSLKNFWYASKIYKEQRGKKIPINPFGAYDVNIGLISLGMIGKMVLEKLKTLDVNIFAYDPFVNEEQAKELGCKILTLDELFQKSHVISCHTPWLKETEKMIKSKHFEYMIPGATFINTARGAVVDEKGMIDVLKKRHDIFAVLDVTWPEPPSNDSELYELPNVFLSPHIAGSMGNECRRMAQYIVEEVKRFINGEKLKYEITEELSKKLA
ncbi:MAG TPA: hydroxyacid dehydrogenase [Victivallales bacterium]|nr:hydroxyacid dehydrogenase [Victivallales bacterium]HPO90241.1 hydroxyacid dehydrogenase [Victivallales bacterium]HRR05893.1 hydroxyacid dehydrogenase [Victivallales bacterium]HRR28156.1 hydroxyacid dehydrogenase [Victivallales bacterium]HRU00278.1 hydroxyacid dehydrogenase [Victivallales bacterium]